MNIGKIPHITSANGKLLARQSSLYFRQRADFECRIQHANASEDIACKGTDGSGSEAKGRLRPSEVAMIEAIECQEMALAFCKDFQTRSRLQNVISELRQRLNSSRLTHPLMA